MSQKREQELRERLEQIIASEFAELDLVKVALVLESMTTDFERRAREAVAQRKSSPSRPGTQAVTSRGVDDARQRSLSSFSSEPSDAGLPEISVVAEDEVQVANLLHQVVEIGALMIQVDEPLKLNEMVTLMIEYSPLQFSIQITGRVVNISARGTAIEVMTLEREDRVALEQLYDDYRHLVAGQSGAPTKPRPRVAPEPASSTKRTGSRVSVKRTGEHSLSSRLGSTINEPRMTVRRQVSLTQPDQALLQTSTEQAESSAKSSSSGAGSEFYGPEREWVVPAGDPDRIEELAGDRIFDILLQLSGHAFSGILELVAPSKTDGDKPDGWQLFFDSGFLADAIRSPRNARVELGHMLLLAKRADKTQLSMAAAHADEHDITLSRSLIELDLLAPETLRHAIAGRLTFLLRLLCNTTEGVVKIYDQRSLPAGFLPGPPLRVHVAVERTIFQLVYEKLRQLGKVERDAQTQAELDTYPEVIREEDERIERALEESELLLMVRKLANGRRRLREVITESTLSNPETFALLFTLHRMGLLRFDRSLHHTVVRERYRENVTVKYLSVHKASYFEVLNVHWSSYDEVVERAYKELIEQFDPSTVPQNLEQEVHTRVQEICERIESAYQVLHRREHRHAYRLRIMPEYKLAHAVPLFLKQAELAERRQQWEDAIDGLRRVLEIEPRHKEATARLKHVELLKDGGLGDDSSSSVL